MNRRVDISVIVPVYNAEKYLSECIESILSQSLQDIELILVNDGSTDASPSLCEDWTSRDDRIRVVHQENGGVSAARNRGIEEAVGIYIAFVDADDFLTPTALSDMWESVENHPGVDVVCASITKGANVIGPTIAIDYTEDRKEIRSRSLYELLNFSACAKLIRRSFLLKNENVRFAKGISVGEDPLFVFFMHKFVRSVAECHRSVYIYRQNDESVMHEKDRTKHEVMSLRVAEIAAQNFGSDGRYVESVFILDRLSMGRLAYVWDNADRRILREQIMHMYNLIRKCEVPFVIRLAAWRLTLPYKLASSRAVDYFLRVWTKVSLSVMKRVG